MNPNSIYIIIDDFNKLIGTEPLIKDFKLIVRKSVDNTQVADVSLTKSSFVPVIGQANCYKAVYTPGLAQEVLYYAELITNYNGGLVSDRSETSNPFRYFAPTHVMTVRLGSQ